MPYKYLIYYSHALIPDAPAEHNKILNKCSANNAAAGLTGFLHREEDFFVQYLEGPEAALYALIDRIRFDPRHENVTIVAEGDLSIPRLSEWQMGFVNGSQLSLVDLVGVVDGKIDIKSADPWDLVEFIIENADSLSDVALAA